MDWIKRLRPRSLEMLVNLDQTRAISRSAASLNSTQPALSRWLKDLEADVGTPLFERHARGLRPTAHGAALVAHARRILGHFDAARDDMAALRDSGGGRIVVGVSGASAASTTPLAVLQMLELHHAVVVKLTEGPMPRLLEQLGDGKIDVVVGRPTAHQDYPPLLTERLYTDVIVFLARIGHPLLDRATLDWEDLLPFRWIVWPVGTPTRDALDEALRAEGRTVPAASIESSTTTFNLTLVTNSDMICLASERDAQHYARWNVARPLPVVVPSQAEVSIYWRDDKDARPLFAAMLDCLRRAGKDQR